MPSTFRDSLGTFKSQPTKNIIHYCSAICTTDSDMTCHRCSEVTTLWHVRNLTIILIIINYYDNVQQGYPTSLRPRAKIRKLEARRAESGVGFWGGEQWAPPHQLLEDLGSTVSSRSGVRGEATAANAFWCILSSEITSGSNFFDYLFKPKKLKWCTLMHFKIRLGLYFRCAYNNWK